MSEANKPDAGTNTGKPSDLEVKIKELEADNFKYREQLRDFKTKFEASETDKRKKEESVLKEANDWKSLADKYKQEAEQRTSELNGFKEKEKEGKKTHSILSELTRLGFDPQYTQDAFKLLDKSKVMIDDETGRVYGADEAAKEFASKYSNFPWFKKQSPGVNHSMPASGQRPNLDLKSMKKDELTKFWKDKLGTRS